MYDHYAIVITPIANGYLVTLPSMAGYAVAQPVRRSLLERVVGDPEYDLADVKQNNVYMFSEIDEALEFVKVSLTKKK